MRVCAGMCGGVWVGYVDGLYLGRAVRIGGGEGGDSTGRNGVDEIRAESVMMDRFLNWLVAEGNRLFGEMKCSPVQCLVGFFYIGTRERRMKKKKTRWQYAMNRGNPTSLREREKKADAPA